MDQPTVPLVLNGRDLTPAALVAVARDRRPVAIDPEARACMIRGRAVVETFLDEERPVYGLNTGLGDRVTHALSGADLAEFSRRTVLGRSNAVGPPLPDEVVRAILAVRLNGLLSGVAGASPQLAESLAALLNADVLPILPSIGSIGASDLCLLAPIGRALLGEGEMRAEGERLPAAEALSRAGLAPGPLAPKDGLAVCNASAASAGLAALALHDAGRAGALADLAAALSLEGFRGNVGPLDPRMAVLRPQPGQAQAATDILGLLADGALVEPGAARRLQDPISLRCVAPVHGALRAALDFAEAAVLPELNGESTNPVVLAEDGEIASTGNFLTPLLALSLDTLGRALVQVATLSVSRASRLLVERLSGLPANLSPHGPARSGFAPLLKPAEALLAEIETYACPVRGGLSLSAEGVEDNMTHAPEAARKVAQIVWRLRLMLGIELLIAAQAVDLRGPLRLGRATARAHALLREAVPPLDDDRALSDDVARLDAELLANGRLLDEIEGG